MFTDNLNLYFCLFENIRDSPMLAVVIGKSIAFIFFIENTKVKLFTKTQYIGERGPFWA